MQKRPIDSLWVHREPRTTAVGGSKSACASGEVRELFKRLPVRHKEFMRNSKSQVAQLLRNDWAAMPGMRHHDSPVHLFSWKIFIWIFCFTQLFVFLAVGFFKDLLVIGVLRVPPWSCLLAFCSKLPYC